MSLRVRLSGICGGISGILLAVAFGYGIFHLVIGPGSFTTGAFLASTLPLFIPIRNDFIQSQRVKASREELLRTIADSKGEHAAKTFALETDGHGSDVVGEIVGLVLATVWFFSR
jgi:hypothetical protein